MTKTTNHHLMQPTVLIGKGGLTESIVKQAKEQLRRRKIIKVKFLASAIKDDKKTLIDEIVAKTGAKLVHKVGFILVLEKVK
ncbi:YhbY family RNA-binding protein [Candidatus Woesearchaeota archaeon]|nr:YhbY family RNA-binding protein [Candidatus Woesearchaeota archaeon]